MRYSFGIERLGGLLAINASQNQKVYLDSFGQIVNSVILFLLRPGKVSLFTYSLLILFTLFDDAFIYPDC